MKQFRRSFGTIHLGHLPDGVSVKDKFDALFSVLRDNPDYTAAAFALEEGDETQTRHIQFYMEHKRKRTTTLAVDLGVSTGYVFQVVRDAPGAWAYCTGTGAHRDKPALDRWFFGEPKLHGDTQRADLKLLIGMILDGSTPEELFQAYPYAWAVHRPRLISFWRDCEDFARRGELRLDR